MLLLLLLLFVVVVVAVVAVVAVAVVAVVHVVPVQDPAFSEKDVEKKSWSRLRNPLFFRKDFRLFRPLFAPGRTRPLKSKGKQKKRKGLKKAWEGSQEGVQEASQGEV